MASRVPVHVEIAVDVAAGGGGAITLQVDEDGSSETATDTASTIRSEPFAFVVTPPQSNRRSPAVATLAC
jgi:hypothetical protein